MTIRGVISPLPPAIVFEADFATDKTLTPTTGPTPIFERASVGKYMNASGVFASAAVDTPRFHHYYLQGAVFSGGLLMEPARTNNYVRSTDLSHASWNGNLITVTNVATSAPDGGNAYRLTESTDSGDEFHRIYQSMSMTSGLNYCHSIFAKAETCKHLLFIGTGPANCSVYFQVEDEVVTNFGADAAFIVRYPNGWMRLIVITEASSSASAQSQWWMSNGRDFYTGSGRSLLTWAPQLEQGDWPSTPIDTTSAVVTRAADSCLIDGNDFSGIYNQAAMMAVVDSRVDALTKSVDFLRIDDETTDNQITVGRNSAGSFAASIKSSGGAQYDKTYAHLFTNGEPITSVIAAKANNMIAGIKGVLLTPVDTGVMPFNPTRMSIGPSINGTIGRVVLYDEKYRSTQDISDLTGSHAQVAPDELSALSNVYTDAQTITVTHSYAKLQRAHTGVDYYQRAAAGGRIRIVTTVPDVKFLFEHDLPHPSSYNGVFCVLVNGTEVDPVNVPESTGQFAIEVVGTGSRTIEIIWPHGGSYRFLGLQRYGSGTITGPTARPTKKLALYGDSITNGYFASRYTKTWAYLLGELQGAEVFNCGYGSEQSGIVGLGTEAGEIDADATLYCIGYNDFGSQVALATYKSNVQTFVDNFRSENATGKLYLGGPFYTPNTNSLTPANYRTQVSDIVTSEADANTILLDTLGAATNDVASWPDTIHPSNVGSSEIATSFDAELDA